MAPGGKIARRSLPLSSGRMTRSLFARGPRSATVAGVLAAGFGFAVLTLSRRGLSADALAWALVQLGLAGIAAYDLITRRIRNLVTVPGALLATATLSCVGCRYAGGLMLQPLFSRCNFTSRMRAICSAISGRP